MTSMQSPRPEHLPKAELHLHIEPELALELADRNDMRLPYTDIEDLCRRYVFEDLGSFLTLYYDTMRVLCTARDFTDLADAYLSRAREQGVRHAEISFDPQAHAARGVAFETVLDGLWRSLSTSIERFGISTRLICSFMRDLGPEQAMQTMHRALPYRDYLTAVGLDSAEVGYPPGPFQEVFAAARDAGLHCVAHAGEEGPPSYIHDALRTLRVERIDHGIRCLDDVALLEQLRRDRTPLTVCPLSNVRLRCVEQLAEHPLPRLLDAGLVVSLNSDDPAYFGGYIHDNYVATARDLGLGRQQLRLLAANSFHAAFLDPEQRRSLLNEVANYTFPENA